MARGFRSRRPPSTGNASLDWQLDHISDALNQIPAFSQISTADGPESLVTADSGTLAFDLGSSATTFWAKESGDTTVGWRALDFPSKTAEWLAYGNLFITSRETINNIGDVSATTLDVFTNSGDTLHVLDSTANSFLQSLRSGRYDFSFEADDVRARGGTTSEVSFTLYKNNSASSFSASVDAIAGGDVSFEGSSVLAAHDDIFAIWIQADTGGGGEEDDIGMSTASFNLWMPSR